MSEARLNLVDHPDGSFSCQAVWRGDFDPRSPSHQNIRILEQYIGVTCGAIPEDMGEEEAASRPTLETHASIHLTDENGGCRMRMSCRHPKAESPAYRACMEAKSFFEFINQAASDALVTREDGLAVVVGKDTINRRPGNL